MKKSTIKKAIFSIIFVEAIVSIIVGFLVYVLWNRIAHHIFKLQEVHYIKIVGLVFVIGLIAIFVGWIIKRKKINKELEELEKKWEAKKAH